MVHNKVSLNAFIKAELGAGAGVYRLGDSPIEYLKLAKPLSYKDSEASKDVPAGSFVSTDGDCVFYSSNMMTFVGRKANEVRE